MKDYLLKLTEAVEKCHAVSAVHVQSMPVKEVFNEAVVWDGVVDVFQIAGHSKASRCYAWGFPLNESKPGQLEIVTVLELPPVTSAQIAVKVAIASTARARGRP